MFRAMRDEEGKHLVINLAQVISFEPIGSNKTLIRLIDREIRVFENFYVLTREIGCLHSEKIGDKRWQ